VTHQGAACDAVCAHFGPTIRINILVTLRIQNYARSRIKCGCWKVLLTVTCDVLALAKLLAGTGKAVYEQFKE